jgi:serralysin
MPAVTTYSLTGDAYVDGVLGDQKWAVTSLSYSFPVSGSYYGTAYGEGENVTSFGALNAGQQTTVRAALRMYAAVANLTFAEISEMASQHADLRFALSNVPGTAWAYFPSTSAEGGDAWFNRTDYNSPVKGNYAYLTFLHEIGHALGLEHAHEHNIMPLDRDSMEYTVMSYRSYAGASTSGGYANETWGYAQSLMVYDIAALQHLYGANYSTNSGNTTYSWSPTTGEMFVNGVGQGAPGGNRILQSVWDGGGQDTYDFSNYATNLTIDLRPGAWTTTFSSQLVKLNWDGSKIAAGNIANALLYQGNASSLIENAVGGSGNDLLTGNQANNALSGGAGNDVLDGGIGADTAVFSGARSQYNLAMISDGSLQIADLRSGAPDGQDVARDVEMFQFADRVYSLKELIGPTINATEPLAYRSVVGTSPSDVTSYDMSLRKAYSLSGDFTSREVRSSSGIDILNGVEILTFADGRLVCDVHDNAAFVYRLYNAVLDRAPDAMGLNSWISALEMGITKHQVANGFIGSGEFKVVYGNLDNEAFVGQLYQNVLNRKGEPEGVGHWTRALDSGTSRTDVVLGFSESQEHINATRQAVEAGLWDQNEAASSVARLYHAVLDRAPDGAGLLRWIDAAPALGLKGVADGFIGSTEFQQKYAGLDNKSFVNQLYLNVLDREGDPGGIANWTNALDTGASRADVVLGFSEALEYQLKMMPLIDQGVWFL